MSQKIVLYIGHLWPEPTSSAAGYRTLALLKAIVNDKIQNDGNISDSESQWQLHFASAAEQTEFCADLDQLHIISHQIKLNDSSFDHFVANLKPDLVFYDRFISEEQFAPRVHAQCPTAINILDTQDLHFLRRARHKAIKDGQPTDLNCLDLQSEDAIREVAAILRCDLSLIISNFEMQLLEQQFKISPELLHYCPFMLSPGKSELNSGSVSDHTSHTTSSIYEQRQHFVMIGNFLHPPNWDAVLWCYQSIWPHIRQQLPHAQVHIYGAYPSDKVWQLHQPEKGFIIKGRAQDAIETLSQYRVNLASLRFGAGLKGKIVDGFMAGTPCVTTEIGHEGMADNLPWGGFVAKNEHDEKQIAQYAIELYQNASLWAQCSQQGYQIIRQQFNEKQHADVLIKKLHELNDNFTGHRKNNFYGQILRHNLYRSQYFMSKWIEEKNAK